MKLHWLTTGATAKRNLKAPTGWKLHLVDVPEEKLEGVYREKALCGLTAKHGWGLDLFINEPCFRCKKAAEKFGLELPKIP